MQSAFCLTQTNLYHPVAVARQPCLQDLVSIRPWEVDIRYLAGDAAHRVWSRCTKEFLVELLCIGVAWTFCRGFRVPIFKRLWRHRGETDTKCRPWRQPEIEKFNGEVIADAAVAKPVFL